MSIELMKKRTQQINENAQKTIIEIGLVTKKNL
jgi:hypothetical protein